MNEADKGTDRIERQARTKELRQGLPDSLKRVEPATLPFDRVRDPWRTSQAKDRSSTDSERQGGRGSGMVKRHKPMPELKPKQRLEPVRKTFNQAWLQEKREAAMAHYEQMARAHHGMQSREQTTSAPSRGRER